MTPAVALAALVVTNPDMGAIDYDRTFVDTFAEACVPGRLNYEATKATALAAGWTIVQRADHPELASVMAKSDEMLASDPDFEMDLVSVLMARDLEGTRHHLAITQSTFVIEEGDDPWVTVGCQLYNFDAVRPIDPAHVTALVGKPISNTVEQDGLVGHVWGPPCPMPRTLDTYLSFIADGSATAEFTGFSGLSMNFSTSTPDAGEEVPETYC